VDAPFPAASRRPADARVHVPRHVHDARDPVGNTTATRRDARRENPRENSGIASDRVQLRALVPNRVHKNGQGVVKWV